jgi:phosphoglycerate kinase
VKKGEIIDPYRIDASLPTIEHIIESGAKLILMSHVGRPRDKATGNITISEKTSTQPIVEYLINKGINITHMPVEDPGEQGISTLAREPLMDLLENHDAVYLPNTRWFAGEEAKDDKMTRFGKELADLADVYVNDAFGSWQPHASTIVPAQHLPAYAGLLMQKELKHLDHVLKPERPFVAVVAGAKFDTKIKPLSALLKLADHLMLGGIIFNAYLSVKYDIEIAGVSNEDKLAAAEFVNLANDFPMQLIEPEFIIEADHPNTKNQGEFRVHKISSLKAGQKLNYVLDCAPSSFEQPKVVDIFSQAGTFFVNAVMGLTPLYSEGTIALDKLIAQNQQALKLFGGGDTLQEFKALLPELYEQALKDEKYYFFTGGGTILKAIAEGSAWGLEPVKALLK